MRTEDEIKAKLKEAWSRYDNETYQIDKDYFDSIVAALMWVVEDGDDPFMDY